MSKDGLERQVHSTYMTLRYGLAVMAFVFPILLWLAGWIHGISLQNSMSAYYHAAPDDGTALVDYFAPRSFFIGLLFAIGACLFLYKGFSKLEDRLLNLASVCACGVALYPMPWHCSGTCPKITLHYVFAVALFVCIGIVAVRCRNETLKYLNDVKAQRAYTQKYLILASAMVASPLLAILTSLFLDEYRKHVFFIEAFGIWAFAAYWWTKSEELKRSETERGPESLLATSVQGTGLM